jgi:hypothetical protein
MKLTISILALFISSTLFAQNPSFDWAKQVGSSSSIFTFSVFADDAGNSYTTGNFEGTADFDPGPGTFSLTSSNSSTFPEAFIYKLDPLGNFVWAKAFISTSSSTIYATCVDQLGNVLVTGKFRGTCDFDPSPTSTFNLTATAGDNAFVCKLTAGGDFIWAKNTGTTVTVGIDIDVDTYGNIITVGYFGYTPDFDPGPSVFNMTSGGSSDAFVSKLDSNGNFIWATQLESTGGGICRKISIDSLGNIYTSGSFTDTAYFDPNTGSFSSISEGARDIFVCKLDTSGNLNWARTVGGTLNDESFSLVAGNSGKVYITGVYSDTVDFDPGASVLIKTSNGGGDIFLMELDSAGNFGWAQVIGGSSDDFGVSIELDNSENIYLNGIFADTVDFDPGPGIYHLTTPPTAVASTFTCKLTNAGTFMWALGLGTIPYLFSKPMTLDASDNVYLAGGFVGTSDFDPGNGVFNMTATSPNSGDAFTLKLNPCESFARYLGICP